MLIALLELEKTPMLASLRNILMKIIYKGVESLHHVVDV